MDQRQLSASEIETRKRLFILRTLVGALFMGVVIFGAVAGLTIVSSSGGTGPPAGPAVRPPLPVLRLVWALLVVGAIPAFLLVRLGTRRVLTAMEPDKRQAAIHGAFFVVTIIGAALAESTGLFGVIIALMNREPLDLLMVIPCLLALMLLFPTRGRFESFRQSLEHDRPFNAP